MWLFQKASFTTAFGNYFGELAPKRAKTLLLVGKVIATEFWDPQSVNYFGYLE